MDNQVKIAWHGKHFGEEPPLVRGKNHGAGSPRSVSFAFDLPKRTRVGAGTIFFSGCNMRCVFCQNYQISQRNFGKMYSIAELADIMLKLQDQNAVCVDLVTPTIWWQAIRETIIMAKGKGLTIPVAWNSNGYEKVEMLKELEGFVDVYLPDFKYGDNAPALKYSGVADYVETAAAAIREMWRQVGLLELDKSGLAKKGLIVRHLVLPSHLENSKQAFAILAGINPLIHVSLMYQYFPLARAKEFPEINRILMNDECDRALDLMWSAGLKNGWVQEAGAEGALIPDFQRDQPFAGDES